MLSQTFHPAPGLAGVHEALLDSDLASARYRRWVTLRRHLVALGDAQQPWRPWRLWRRRERSERRRWIRALQPASGTLSRLP